MINDGVDDFQLPAIEEDCDLLIIKGAENTDDLVPLGLPLATRFQRAKSVVLIPDRGILRTVKGDAGKAFFIDIDSRSSRLATILDGIAKAYTNAHPKDARLAHDFVGLFLFYFHLEVDGTPRRILDLIGDGDIESVEKCAEIYIENDFNVTFVRLGAERDDEPRSAAAGRWDDSSTATSARTPTTA